MKISVKFIKKYRGYKTGSVESFKKPIATVFVKMGVAEYVEDQVPEVKAPAPEKKKPGRPRKSEGKPE